MSQQSSNFEPVSLGDLRSAIARLLPGEKLEQGAAWLAEKPARNTAALVGITTILFYLAERGHNEKVKSVFDASMYCSTCLNAGSADVVATTPVGKMIGTLLMTMGPGLATRMMVGETAKGARTQEQILATLESILKEMEASRAALKGV